MAWFSIADVKIGPINLRFGENTNSRSHEVLSRVRRLIDSHGLESAQLLRLVPRHWDWRLATVDDDKELCRALGNEQFTWFSKTFNVNREWLEGAQVQNHRSVATPLRGYKCLDQLGADLHSLGWLEGELHMSILAERYCRSDGPLGRYAILFSHPLRIEYAEDPVTYVHALFEGEWNYRHPPCKNDTLLVARWFARRDESIETIPIHPVTELDFSRLMKGNALPGEFFFLQRGGCDRLEDRILSPKESAKAIPGVVIDSVIEGIRSSGLGRYRFANS